MSHAGWENGMTLGDLIEELKKVTGNRIIKFGFNRPHSYRGYYDELAFEPKANVPARSMLVCAESALGKRFMGYKGGEYEMTETTDCWISRYGCCGVSLTPELLGWMLGKRLIDYEHIWSETEDGADE